MRSEAALRIRSRYVLYIDSRTMGCRKALARVRDMFKRRDDALEIIDVSEVHVQVDEGVAIVPSLVRVQPEPRRTLVLHADAPEELTRFVTDGTRSRTA